MGMPAAWTIPLLLLLSAPGGEALLVPDQLVSFMHILYSTIPVIRKGTDSRVGFGFRFGPHADAQVLLELGPQTRTGALTQVTTPKQTLFADPGKRHVPVDDPLGGHAVVGDLDDNHIRGRALQFGSSSGVGASPSDGGGDRGGEWLTRWRSGWAASGATPSASPPPAPQRSGRGSRIALAPWAPAMLSSSSQPPLSFGRASSPAVREDLVVAAAGSSPLRFARAESPPMTSTPAPPVPPGALHLRDVMVQLASRTTPRTPTTRTTSRTRTPTSSPPRTRTPLAPAPQPPLFQGGILRALRQLWEAGARTARAANSG